MNIGNFLHYTFVAYFLISFVYASRTRNQVTLEDGGYKDLLIAIDNEETVDDGLIENIKEIFTQGSSFLFEATNRRVYWKSIKILVPLSWPRLEEYKSARTETFERANVVITGDDDGPYVQRTEGCGKQGEQMYLSPKYVRNKTHSNLWGPRNKTIVHEWAHLRWGVFDEYAYGPTDKNPKFFQDGGIEATRCSKSITGNYKDSTSISGLCRKGTSGVFTDNCTFTEHTQQTPKASLMYKHFLSSVIYFCRNDTQDAEEKHYEEAPNDQNRRCNRQGVWDVMMQTDDFKDGNSPPILGNVNLSPTFTIIQTTTRRVVLVLDVSGSMQGPPLEKLRQAVIHYIDSTVPNGSYVGIVSFNTAGYQLAPLTLVDGSRESLEQLLPTHAQGGTSIGSGVRKAIELLSSSGQSTEGGYLIVISDGKNTHSPDINDVIDDVKNAGVIVDVIAITPNADSELESLSNVSGGFSYFYRSDSDSITILVNALKATITARPDQTNEYLPITVYNEALSINAATGNASGYLHIESSVGVDTMFSFSWLHDPVMVSVESPDGYTFDQSSSEYNLNSDDKIITITIGGRASAGYWNFHISTSPSPFSAIVSVTVDSKQSSEDVPVTVTSFVSQPSVDYQIVTYITIFAFVTKGNDAVANADVIAIVERPNAPDDVIELYDSGSNADIFEHDGVYSAYFLYFTGNGRYNVEVKVRGTNQTSIVKNQRNLPIQAVKETVMEPVEMFQRSTSGGSIQVYNYVDNDIDILAPSQIMDLTNIGVSYQEQSVTLQWTAVGDDFDKGEVAEYDLRFAETFQNILRSFSESTRVTFDDVINGSLLVIKEPGQLEQITIKLPNRGDNVSYYFAIVAIDDTNNTGPLSNIVSANLEYIPPLVPDATTTTATTITATTTNTPTTPTTTATTTATTTTTPTTPSTTTTTPTITTTATNNTNTTVAITRPTTDNNDKLIIIVVISVVAVMAIVIFTIILYLKRKQRLLIITNNYTNKRASVMGTFNPAYEII